MSKIDQPAGADGGDTGTSNSARSPELPERIRVHALAKLLGITSRELVTELGELGEHPRSAQSSVSRAVAQAVFDRRASAAEPEPAAEPAEPVAAEPAAAEPESVSPEPVSPEPASPEPASAEAAPSGALAPVFTPPSPVFLPPRQEASTPAPSATDEQESAAEVEDTPDDDGSAADEDLNGRRRRRRGRRGRGRGKGGADDVEGAVADKEAGKDGDASRAKAEDAERDKAGQSDGESTKKGKSAKSNKSAKSGKSDDSSQVTDGGTAAEDGATKDEPAEVDGAEDADGGSRRRRRRRRRKGNGDDDGTTSSADDPPNTVTHVREAREEKSDARNEVRSVRGSTRLEAKRQRRRDGREAGRRRAPIVSEAEFLARRESVARSMVVRESGDSTQIGVLEDGVLVEHFVTSSGTGSLVGNVYLGRVQNVLPSMEAAFVDIGRGRNAVLYAGEVDWDAAGLEGKSRRIEQALATGDSVLVQVTKDPAGHKGARLTTQISLPGRFLVYVPSGGATGISRKLPENERKRLKDILKRIVPDDAGVIIRTASEGISEDELARDVRRLQAQWQVIKDKAEGGDNVKKASAPALLYEEPDLLIKVVRDLFTEDFTSLTVEGATAWETIEAYVQHVAPDLTDRLKRHVGGPDVFSVHRIDEQITKALDRKVWLPSGGYLVIDRTEAMTVIDVNTGKFTGSGGNLEETVTRNNLEAAEEIVRQLRLRDIGGIIVIDFIDMVLESNRDLVLRRLTECLGRDRTRHQVAEVTSLGLVQMTRKRVGTGLLEAYSTTCEHCRGRGVVVSTEPTKSGNGNGNGGGNGNQQSQGGSRRSRQRGRGDDRAKGEDRAKGTDDKTEDKSGPDKSGPDKTGPDKSGPDTSGPDASGAEQSDSAKPAADVPVKPAEPVVEQSGAVIEPPAAEPSGPAVEQATEPAEPGKPAEPAKTAEPAVNVSSGSKPRGRGQRPAGPPATATVVEPVRVPASTTTGDPAASGRPASNGAASAEQAASTGHGSAAVRESGESGAARPRPRAPRRAASRPAGPPPGAQQDS